LHAEPFGSAAVHASVDSLQLSAQLASPSAPWHGLPAWVEQTPVLHVSAPLQYSPSLQLEPLASRWHVDEQQSPLATFPSSHCSFESTVPLPQVAALVTVMLTAFG